jgi:hypothetical protein
MRCRDVYLILFGAILGFVFSMLGEYIRRVWDRRERRRLGKELLAAIVEELEQGISRCEYLVKARSEKRISFSRIYIALWDSSKVELSQYIEDLKAPEVLRLLHKIYYRFDLINFNMEREEFAVGSAFAEQYLSEIRENLSELKDRLSNLNVRLGAS